VVVPTLNRGGYLVDCLRDLSKQDLPDFEILVVDQSEEEDPVVGALVEDLGPKISYYRVKFRGLPEARNFGWQRAKHEALLFVDDDIRCGPTLLSQHVRALSIPGVGVVAGGIEEPNVGLDAGPRVGHFNPWTGEPKAGFASRGAFDVDHAKGCNFSTWRSVLKEAGGFDERLNVGAALYEELDFCLRASALGHRIYFDGDARLTHLVAPSGGCRVDQVDAYVHALAHNRALIINRHVRTHRTPLAYAHLLRLGLAHAHHYRKPTAILHCVRGALEGIADGRKNTRCTDAASRSLRETIGSDV